MKNNFITIFSIVFLAFYVCIVGFLSTSIILQIKNGNRNAEIEFSKIITHLRTLSEKNDFLGEDYIAQLKKSLAENPLFGGIIIEKNSQVQFAYPIQSKYIQPNEKQEPKIESNSPFVKIYTASVSVKEPYDTKVLAAVHILPFNSILSLLQFSFFAVLIPTLLILFVMLIVGNEKLDDSELVQAQKDLVQVEITTPQATKTTIEKNTTTVKVTHAEEPLNGAFCAEKHNPLGLFSQTTGLGWYDYLETRLDSELLSSISHEQDIGILLLQIANLSHETASAKKIGNLLLSHFQFRDLLFEYKTDGYAVIFQNTNLDSAISLCEDLYLQLEKIIQEDGLHTKIAMGLSSRSCRRPITGSRLLNEAEMALEKGLHDTVYPIIAFKVNNEKYSTYFDAPHSQNTIG